MEGVNVYLYANYTFLSDFRGNSSAAIMTSTTNSLGNVVFHNLTANQYFLYAEKIIALGEEADTLHSFVADFDPESEPVLDQLEINEFNLEIK